MTPLLRLVTVLVLVLSAACGAGDTGDGDIPETDVAAEARALTSEEAQRLAATGVSAYRAKVRTVEGSVVSDAGVVQIQGWIDTVDHWAYGLISGPGVTPFLAVWTETSILAQDFGGASPPLPVPGENWSPSMGLDPEASYLAAAQILLASLADTTPENPQLLAQDGSLWWRKDRIGDTPVDVMSGPIPTGQTSSSFRYWIDGDGSLLRVEARLDGTRWSSFTFADAPDVTLERPLSAH